MKRKMSRRFVPRVVLGMGMVGVVPACAIQACSSGTLAPADAGKDQGYSVADGAFSVAASCFGNPTPPGCRDGIAPSVANIGFDAPFAVADAGFGADTTIDAPDDIQEAGPDLIFSVAALGFAGEKTDKKRA
jgi:hypothetical protein